MLSSFRDHFFCELFMAIGLFDRIWLKFWIRWVYNASNEQSGWNLLSYFNLIVIDTVLEYHLIYEWKEKILVGGKFSKVRKSKCCMTCKWWLFLTIFKNSLLNLWPILKFTVLKGLDYNNERQLTECILYLASPQMI